MASGTSDSSKQPTDTYARLAHLLPGPVPHREALLDRLYKEVLSHESRAYAAGWSDAMAWVRQARKADAGRTRQGVHPLG
ncbi:hypothetical protein ABTY20_05000 [Streptomyces sp. NPDC126497]|uniref:hypothetical protein n=1 Tax=Streptomyces sp. NPDC126497 TaxID=3155313 RepID=UPI003323B2A1